MVLSSMKINKNIQRDPVATRNHILDVAFRLVYRHSFKGTSTNQIIEALDCTRGAFFHHFPTKDNLGYALVDEVLTGMIIQRWIHPISAKDNKIEAIIENFLHLIKIHEEGNILCGCPLNNMVQEMSDQPEFQRRIQAVMEMWVSETQKLLTQAKRAGHLQKSVDSRVLAEFIVAQEEAAFAMGKAFNSRAAMRSIHKSFETYLRSLT